MKEKDYRKEGEEMEKKKKKKYSRTDKVILGIGFTILGLFVLSIAIPIIYVVLASFMDPTVLNNQGLSFNIKDWTLDAYRRVFENEKIWRGFLNSFLYSLTIPLCKICFQFDRQIQRTHAEQHAAALFAQCLLIRCPDLRFRADIRASCFSEVLCKHF